MKKFLVPVAAFLLSGPALANNDVAASICG